MLQLKTTNNQFSLTPKGKSNSMLFNLLSSPLERLLHLKGCGRLYDDLSRESSPVSFMQKMLSALNVTTDLTEPRKCRIPSTGPCVVIANHPFGAIEGIVLAEALCSIRSDVKIIANTLLGRIPQLRELIFPVDVFSGKRAAHTNMRALRDALRWVREGHMLMVFPAGEVSHLNMTMGKICDPPWHPGIGKLISTAKAPVLPVFFKGANSPVFQLAGLIHPRLRTAMLPRELLNKKEKRIQMRIGKPIAGSRLARFENHGELLDYLRWRTYLLGGAEMPSRSLIPSPRKKLNKSTKPVPPPQVPFALQREIEALPISQKLAESGDHVVWQAMAHQIPKTLMELGRLREITFRLANEGTGNPRDLDIFDHHYHHIFIWNQKASQLVGAYRIGCTDTILSSFGPRGLYTSTLFKSHRRVYDLIGPAIELGRSFVREEYQRSYAPLLLLWKGIGRFVVQNPRYRMLFGPVSISRDYSDLSRQLIASTLLKHSTAKDIAAMIRPKTPPRIKPLCLPGLRKGKQSQYCHDMEEVCSVIADIELEVQSIPVLLKHYLNLGGQLLSFNIDKKFGDTMDGLILVDLLQAPEKTLSRYFGRDGVSRFYGYHGLGVLSDPSGSAAERLPKAS